MLKRIHVQQLCLGMYLHEFCGSWIEHPFWRSRFLLEDPQDLLRIRETNIQEVLIDISKGLDVAEPKTDAATPVQPKPLPTQQAAPAVTPWRRSCSAPAASAPTPSGP